MFFSDKDKSIEPQIKKMIELVRQFIFKSSTLESLNPNGYPENGPIEKTIRSYQNENLTLYQQGLTAMQTNCGNCQEMSYACALLLRASGFTGSIHVAQFGLNHAFLIVENYIVDPWAETYFLFSTWPDNLTAYGGSVKNGIMRGRILPTTHLELEDERPEISQTVPPDLEKCLPFLEDRSNLMELLKKQNLRPKRHDSI